MKKNQVIGLITFAFAVLTVISLFLSAGYYDITSVRVHMTFFDRVKTIGAVGNGFSIIAGVFTIITIIVSAALVAMGFLLLFDRTAKNVVPFYKLFMRVLGITILVVAISSFCYYFISRGTGEVGIGIFVLAVIGVAAIVTPSILKPKKIDTKKN